MAGPRGSGWVSKRLDLKREGPFRSRVQAALPHLFPDCFECCQASLAERLHRQETASSINCRLLQPRRQSVPIGDTPCIASAAANCHSCRAVPPPCPKQSDRVPSKTMRARLLLVSRQAPSRDRSTRTIAASDQSYFSWRICATWPPFLPSSAGRSGEHRRFQAISVGSGHSTPNNRCLQRLGRMRWIETSAEVRDRPPVARRNSTGSFRQHTLFRSTSPALLLLKNPPLLDRRRKTP